MAKISFHLHKHQDVSEVNDQMTKGAFFTDKWIMFQTLRYYKQLLTYTKSAVTRNYSEKSINNILDYVSTADDMAFVEQFYQVSLEALSEMKNEVSYSMHTIRTSCNKGIW